MIYLSTDDLSNLRAFELAPDLLLADSMKATISRGKKQAKWQPIFWPDNFVKDKHDMSVAGNKLSDAKLQKYAKRVS